MIPTYIHRLFDGTKTSLGPLKLGATYLGIALVSVAGCFAIATNEVPLPSFLSIESSLTEMGLGVLPRGHKFAMWTFLVMSSKLSLIEPFLPCSFVASHCLVSHELLKPSSQVVGHLEAKCPISSHLKYLMRAKSLFSI
jgi:hypothetical protein